MARVLLLVPSEGLGGGIERYAETVEDELGSRGFEVTRINLHHQIRRGRVSGRVILMRRALAAARQCAEPPRVIALHPSLTPEARMLRRRTGASEVTVVCHGNDIWARRQTWSQRLLRSTHVRVVAVSNFSAGALLSTTRAVVLPPGLSRSWFDKLVRAGDRRVNARPGPFRVLTVFRLVDWKKKGLKELREALARQSSQATELVVAGSGAPPTDLRDFIAGSSSCTLLENLTDEELAAEYARADLFALCTRMRSGGQPSGEGFGMVLLEAQVAGTPVLAPAFGGAGDAFLPGVTGLSPSNEGVDSLADSLKWLLSDTERLQDMSSYAREWTRRQFAPDAHARLAEIRLL